MNQSNSVHPSRASFVLQSRPTASSFDPPRQRSRSPPPHRRSRSPPPHQRRASPSHDRRASPCYESYDRVESRRADDQEREEERKRRERDEMRRERERRDGEREERGLERERRATPERGLGGGRGGYGGGMGRGGGGAGGGEDWFESRRKERDNSAVTIWPPSPRAPERAASPSGKKSSSKKHRSSKSRRRRDSPSSSDSSSSDSEDDRRRSKKHKHRHTKSSKPKSSRRDERERSRSVEQRVVVRKEDEGDEDEDEDMWVEKPSAVVVDEGDEEVGPLPLFVPGQKGGRNSYGGALLKGEGSAMAAFVAEGERIPRRGEIGMESDEIERFEQIGYVMSGSRHRRMNAVRVRKENQVISAEEKRGILKMQAEEKAKRENQIVASFKELVDTRLAKK